jgi:MoaA/NifB/PqqE/SkfB family radical SAM enzyme
MIQGRVAQQGRLRSWDILRLLSPRTLWRMARGVVRATVDGNYAGSPLAVCWFITFACNARCGFCCKAAEVRAGREAYPPVAPEAATKLLRRIRRSVNILYLSGGEPLVHPHLPEILTEARRLRFAQVGMSTNAIVLDRRADLLDLLDVVGVSIHAPDPAGHASGLGVEESIARRALENLDLLADWRGRTGKRVIINCVMHPGNLGRIEAMIELTAARGFLLELVPANTKRGVDPALAADPAYHALIDRLLEMRRDGRASHLAGSTAYYRRLQSLKPFRCFPYGVPNILPDGRLCTPCDVSGQHAVDLLDHPSLKAAVKASRPHLGAYPCRKGHCFKAGILERSRLFGLLSPEAPQ